MGLLIFVTAFRFAGSEPHVVERAAPEPHVVERAVPEPTLALDVLVERAVPEPTLALDFLVERAVPEPTLGFDFVVEEPPATQSIDLHLELRDNSAPGDWSRTEDYELAATRGALTFTCNNHFIVRNMSEAQLVASFTIEY